MDGYVAHLAFVLLLGMATRVNKSAAKARKGAVSRKAKPSLVEEVLTKKLSVGVRELRQDASKVLKLVKSGEIVIVTERGKPVAEIRPTRATTIQDLIDAGLVRPAKNRFDSKVWEPLPNPKGLDLLGEFLKERREARY